MLNSNDFLKLFNLIAYYHFSNEIDRTKSDRYYSKCFRTVHQFKVLLYSQITGKVSLRDIESSLKVGKCMNLCNLGIESISKSALSAAMMRRSSTIFENTFYELLDKIYALTSGSKNIKFKFNNPLHSIDSSVIDLCLSQFNWAHYCKSKSAIKIYAELDNNGNLPCLIRITEGNISDIKAVKKYINIIKDSIYVFDNGYHMMFSGLST